MVVFPRVAKNLCTRNSAKQITVIPLVGRRMTLRGGMMAFSSLFRTERTHPPVWHRRFEVYRFVYNNRRTANNLNKITFNLSSACSPSRSRVSHQSNIQGIYTHIFSLTPQPHNGTVWSTFLLVALGGSRIHPAQTFTHVAHKLTGMWCLSVCVCVCVAV